MKNTLAAIALSVLASGLASCGTAPAGEKPASTASRTEDSAPFETAEMARYEAPWAIAFLPGAGGAFLVTEKLGAIKGQDAQGRALTVSGVPTVDHGGQGGLGDIAFLPSQSGSLTGSRAIYLSWAEAGSNDARGAAVGRGTLVCTDTQSCEIRDMAVIWRQNPKVTGRGHYSHRLAFSPDRKFLYIGSGDRQKLTPAQDPASDLGKMIRLPIDAQGLPAGPAEQVSMGHRNILGMTFDSQGRLWEYEHGPAGGDELNLVRPGANYGWPVVSQGDHYDGRAIPRHPTRIDFAPPAIAWTPVVGGAGLIAYSGKQFPQWRGQLLIAGLVSQGLVRVGIEVDGARELARYWLGRRIRGLAEHPDGSIWVLEDGTNARLLRLSAKTR